MLVVCKLGPAIVITGFPTFGCFAPLNLYELDECRTGDDSSEICVNGSKTKPYLLVLIQITWKESCGTAGTYTSRTHYLPLVTYCSQSYSTTS